MKYNFAEFEPKWQSAWEKDGIFESSVNSLLPKYYCLEMFPYPSGNIHMGHVRNYAIGDVTARHKFMRGYNVLHPIGWDAFGLPAENAAKQNKSHPSDWTYSNIEVMKKQLKRLGLSYDWSKEITTCDPEYYKWEQELFINMWERGLAYKKKSRVNWCESCETVLANEQVEDGKCWRCSSEVTLKELEQWFLKITEYADELLESTYNMQGWPEKVLVMQRNWIGKSVGAEIEFDLSDMSDKIIVFSTRPDTIFGATFMLIAPGHPMAKNLVEKGGNKETGFKFIEEMIQEQTEAAKNPQDSIDNKEKKGFDTGVTCINPVTGEHIPVYIANYVLMGYGTGAVMAVPAHDQRDFDFAKKYNLQIKEVITPVDVDNEELEEAYSGDGILVNSDQFDGMTVEEAKLAIVKYLQENGDGKHSTTYRLRDWGVSRQRYWGAPVPFIHCDKCGTVPVDKKDLPVLLPKDVDFTQSGNPLDSVESFVNTKCPKCGGSAKRETDTMDTFMESSWYFLRFCSPHFNKGIFDKDAVNYWMPVDQYIGGVEHAVMHLLYARFLTKVLRDFGYFKFDEPFTNLLTQGMVCKETYKCPVHGWLFPSEMVDGKCVHCESPVTVGRIEKMSKSKKNVVDPDSLVEKYGADTLRLFSLFSAPPDKESEWSDSGVEGCYRFINRVYRLFMSNTDLYDMPECCVPCGGVTGDILKYTHQTIKKVTNDIEKFQFNTAVAAIMEFVNNLYTLQRQLNTAEDKGAFKCAMNNLIILLTPFTPHLSEELWNAAKQDGYVSRVQWPTFKEEYLVEDTITVVVQINGKVRDELKLQRDCGEREAFDAALASEKVQSFLDGKQLVKKIYVKGKLVSLVVK